jgi:hypothetical protein
MPEPDKNLTPGQEQDAVAAYLTAAHERWGTAENFRNSSYPTALEHLGKALRSLADAPPLIAAVRAALELGADWEAESLKLDTMADRCDTALRRGVLSVRAQGCDDHGSALLSAISAALTGEDGAK